MGSLMVNLLLTWALGVTGAGQTGKTPSPPTVRLYIFTAPALPTSTEAETEESDLKERLQAVQDMANWLQDKRKKTITVVAGRDQADAVVEVTAVQHEAGMSLTQRTAGYLHGPRYDTWTVRVKVMAGTFTNDVTRQGQFPVLAAEAAADDVERWARRNLDLLIAARPK
jgi:hypothetical protein